MTSNNCIIDAVLYKYPSYLLSSKATQLYSTGLLDLKVYALNLRRQVS